MTEYMADKAKRIKWVRAREHGYRAYLDGKYIGLAGRRGPKQWVAFRDGQQIGTAYQSRIDAAKYGLLRESDGE